MKKGCKKKLTNLRNPGDRFINNLLGGQMMKIQEIEEEINQMKIHLSFLENRLKENQKNCDHHFLMNLSHEKCLKCNKVNVFHY